MKSRAVCTQSAAQRVPITLRRAGITLLAPRRPHPTVRRQLRRSNAVSASASAAASAAAPAGVGLPQAYGYVWCVVTCTQVTQCDYWTARVNEQLNTQISDGVSGLHSRCCAVDGFLSC